VSGKWQRKGDVKGALFSSELVGILAFFKKFCPRLHSLLEFQALPGLSIQVRGLRIEEEKK